MAGALTAPTIGQIREARARIAAHVLETPLIAMDRDTGEPSISLKLENLQPIGSFKLRGALNRITALSAADLAEGVYTASAGNMAQGVAWAARARSVPATVIVPDTAPVTKLEAIRRLGGAIVPVPFDDWWEAMRAHGRVGMAGTFIHPFADALVMAGNGTIALEVLERLPQVDVMLVPWGGGGLACGIAAAMAAVAPHVRVFACEVQGAAPLEASLRAGQPVRIENRRSFVDGIGGPSVFPEMWPLARQLLAGSLVVTLEEVADALRLLAARHHIVAEGAGAVSVAAALKSVSHITPAPTHMVCVVSGGNLDPAKLLTILSGSIP